MSIEAIALRSVFAALAMTCAALVPGQTLAEDVQIVWQETCPVGAAPQTRCGELLVPERRGKPGTPTIKVPIAIVPAPDQAKKAKDPFLFLMGGTGGGFGVLADLAILPGLMNRDVIVVEQRGNPMATPFFGCPSVPYANRLHLVYNSSVEYTGPASVETCKQDLLNKGIDLNAYTTPHAAEDLVDLRKALGISEWNVYGVSYGGRVATTLMRKDAEAMRSVILDSAQITGIWFSTWERLGALGTFFDRCAAATHCGSLYPNLREAFETTLARVAKNPEKVKTPAGKDVIDGQGYLHLVVWALYQLDLDVTSRVPEAIMAARDGDFNALLAMSGFYRSYQPAYKSPNIGYTPLAVHNAQQISMLCAEEFPYNRDDSGAKSAAQNGWRESTINVLKGIETTEREICDAWAFEPADPRQAKPPVGDRPTLILYAEHDTIAPPSHGRMAAASLSNAQFFSFPWTAHGVISERPQCSLGLMRQFIENPGGRLEASCVAAIPEPAWVPPEGGAKGDHPLALLHAHAANSAAKFNLPGRAIHVIAPEIDVAGTVAVGHSEHAALTPLTGYETFRIASQTKMFTAVAVLRLVEMGNVALDQGIETLLSQETQSLLSKGGYDLTRITVRQLLEHRTGLPDYAMDPGYQQAVFTNPNKIWTREEQIEWGTQKMASVGSPGERYHYSDTGYVLLGEIIERASGLAQADAYRQLIDYKKLGLKHTWFETLEPAPERTPSRAQQLVRGVDANMVHPSSDLYGGGGLVSTLQDQAQFLTRLFAGDVFEKAGTLKAMTSVTPANMYNKEGDGYALGIRQVTVDGVVCWGHAGFFGSAVYHCPKVNLTISANRYQVETPPLYDGAGALKSAILMQRLRRDRADYR